MLCLPESVSPVVSVHKRIESLHEYDLTETTYHTIQQCPRTHEWRVRRHDMLVNYIAKINNNDYKRCLVEPRIVTDCGLWKPNHLIIEDRAATVSTYRSPGMIAIALTILIEGK